MVPQAAPAAALEKVLGAPGTTSIRASFGNFYTAIDALSISVLAANAPYGTTYTSPLRRCSRPLYYRRQTAELWPAVSLHVCAFGSSRSIPTAASTGAPMCRSAAFPGTTFITARRIPRSGCSRLSARLGQTRSSPQTMSAPRATASVFWSSQSGHPALCLSLSQPSEVQPGTLTCGACGETRSTIPSAAAR